MELRVEEIKKKAAEAANGGAAPPGLMLPMETRSESSRTMVS